MSVVVAWPPFPVISRRPSLLLLLRLLLLPVLNAPVTFDDDASVGITMDQAILLQVKHGKVKLPTINSNRAN